MAANAEDSPASPVTDREMMALSVRRYCASDASRVLELHEERDG